MDRVSRNEPHSAFSNDNTRDFLEQEQVFFMDVLIARFAKNKKAIILTYMGIAI